MEGAVNKTSLLSETRRNSARRKRAKTVRRQNAGALPLMEIANNTFSKYPILTIPNAYRIPSFSILSISQFNQPTKIITKKKNFCIRFFNARVGRRAIGRNNGKRVFKFPRRRRCLRARFVRLVGAIPLSRRTRRRPSFSQRRETVSQVPSPTAPRSRRCRLLSRRVRQGSSSEIPVDKSREKTCRTKEP